MKDGTNTEMNNMLNDKLFRAEINKMKPDLKGSYQKIADELRVHRQSVYNYMSGNAPKDLVYRNKILAACRKVIQMTNSTATA